MTDPRDTFAAANPISSHHAKLPEAAINDIIYFAELAKRDPSKAIPFTALARWLKEQHNVVLGRLRAMRLIEEKGYTAWWK